MDADQIGVTLEGELVTGVQLLTPHGANFPVYGDEAFLDLIFGAAAGGTQFTSFMADSSLINSVPITTGMALSFFFTITFILCSNYLL